MESARSYYYSVTKRMLLLTGQWPYQRRGVRILVLTLVTVATLSAIAPQVCKFVRCGEDVQCIVITIPSFLLTTMMMVKLFSCQFNSSKIKDLTDYLYSDWENLEASEGYEILKTYAANGRSISLIYSLYCFMCGALFILVSLVPYVLDIALPLNESRPIVMPYEAYYFVDEAEYYFYILLHALVSVEIGMTGLLAHDCMVLTYIQHVCSVFAVSGFYFEHLTNNKHIGVASNNADDTYRRKITLSVNTHWRALKFAELLEDTFCLSFAVQIMIITAGLSITLLEITLQLHNTMEVARYAAFVVGQLIHLFYFSLQGQKLIDHSLQMRDKVYNCAWYETPVRSQRLLVYVMRKSLQPNFLSAGKIYVFSLKSFTTVLQTSMSYFTVLLSFQ